MKKENKKRLINEDEKYIRKFMIANYKRIHKYNVKSLITFFITGICSVFLFIFIAPSILKVKSISSLIIKILFELVIGLYAYVSLRICIRNRKDMFNHNLRDYKNSNIYILETKLLRVEESNGYDNDLGYVTGLDGEETFGILFSYDEIEANNNKCFLVFDPVVTDIRYVVPIRKDKIELDEEDDEDE